MHRRFHTFPILTGTMRELSPTNARCDSPTAIAWRHCYVRCVQVVAIQTRYAYTADRADDLARKITHYSQVHIAPDNAGAQIALTAFSLLAATCKALGEDGLGRDQSLLVTGKCFNTTYRAFIRHVCQPLYYCGPAHTARLQALNFEAFSAELAGPADQGRCPFNSIFAHHDLDSYSAAALGAVVRNADCAWKRTLDALLLTRAAEGDPAFKPFYFAPRPTARAKRADPPVLVLTPGL
jgi:hypothetical protein